MTIYDAYGKDKKEREDEYLLKKYGIEGFALIQVLSDIPCRDSIWGMVATLKKTWKENSRNLVTFSKW